jgi:processive 1,2-diacylglycerol beta-glucosyltransferase
LNKPRVIFPYVEAGLGHIMPAKSISEAFEKKYGAFAEVSRPFFYSETGNAHMIAFEKMMEGEVVKHNKDPHYGYFANIAMDFFGTGLSSLGAMELRWPKSARGSFEHMCALAPDMVVSTHWSTNYYAYNLKPRPLTVMYCPDARINTLFRYRADMTLTPYPCAYTYSLKKYRRRFNDGNLKLVPFPIRKEAFDIPDDKPALRKKLGLDPEKFTVVLAEGGYGVGKMQAISELLIRTDMRLNVVAVCGKNEALHRRLLSLPVSAGVTFLPLGFCDNMLEIEASADLFMGKSGTIIAELCFFCVPQIITNYATQIEQHIGENYIENVGSALKIFDPAEAVKKVREFHDRPDILDIYKTRMKAFRDSCGGEGAADEIFAVLKTRFPRLGE